MLRLRSLPQWISSGLDCVAQGTCGVEDMKCSLEAMLRSGVTKNGEADLRDSWWCTTLSSP